MFQSPSEARGGGGLIGVYGVLSANRGSVSLDHIGPIEELGPLVRPPVKAPLPFTRLYGPLSALRDWRQANVSPDFPVTSSVLLDMYERVKAQRLDGVIALDPLALGELTRGTGPLRAEGWDQTVTRRNVRRLLLFRIYKHFVHQEARQNSYLRDLVAAAWAPIRSGQLDAAGLLTGLARSTAKHHLKIYSDHPAEQELLVDLGVAGDLSVAEEPFQMIFNNNNSGNKLDSSYTGINVSRSRSRRTGARPSIHRLNSPMRFRRRGCQPLAAPALTPALSSGRTGCRCISCSRRDLGIGA